MVSNSKLTLTGVAAHTAPSGLTAFLSFLWQRRKNSKAGLPGKELTYHEGVKIVRAFLAYAAKHGVGELQKFTAAHVPAPTWVSKLVVTIPNENIDEAANLLRKALAVDPQTVELVGGEKWWSLRGRDLTGEWIEMKKDKLKRGGNPPEKVLLYLHGGAHFFSSLETHRYQIQRHARKLGARAFAPSQRLAPQYPFPCALHDALAAYLFLIRPPSQETTTAADSTAHEENGTQKGKKVPLHDPVAPENIIISGDSAGGGLALSLLVLLRDLGLPMPAGATLISPWVDLAHSFPSVGGDGNGDYIPPNGFIYRPDLVWPPPPNPTTAIEQTLVGEESLTENGHKVVVRLEDQVQMYCPNNMLDHPLVSPVNQGSLGGLPPLYLCCGSSELLHDEIIYLAHKCANPSAYPPAQRIFEQYPSQKAHYEQKYPPTKVQLQVFDGGCHVVTTLSVTSLAKYMYRGAANAGLFFLAAAKAKKARRGSRHHDQATTTSAVNPDAPVAPALRKSDHEAANEVDHPTEELDSGSDTEGYADEEGFENDEASESSNGSESSDEPPPPSEENTAPKRVTATGHLPPFSSSSSASSGASNMIRQRVSLYGIIRPLEPPSELDGCTMNPEHIGRLHAIPVRKWLKQRAEWDAKYASDLDKYRAIKTKDRVLAEEGGFLLGQFKGERPPLGSVAGWWDQTMAKEAAASVDEIGHKTSASMALAAWSRISAKPDEEKAGDEKVAETEVKVGKEQVKEAEETEHM
ncbi:hypothetical protein JCM6882_002454 [Rhodosporidiobolus microsporus]